MLLPASSRQVPRLIQLASIASTNAELVRLVGEQSFGQELPDFTTVVTDDQTAGRGRRGRTWMAPAGSSLAISVLLRPRTPEGVVLDASRFSWLPLAAGVAMTDAIRSMLPEAIVGVKWPNDVQVGGRKICGILGELLPSGTGAGTAARATSGAGVVLGAGVNIAMTTEQLPVPTATSLAIEGAATDGVPGQERGDELPDRVLAAYLARLVELVDSYGAHGGDPEASGLRAAVVERCTTLGREVRAELPGDEELAGSAVGIDRQGRLEIRTASGRVQPVAAGDIIHLR